MVVWDNQRRISEVHLSLNEKQDDRPLNESARAATVSDDDGCAQSPEAALPAMEDAENNG